MQKQQYLNFCDALARNIFDKPDIGAYEFNEDTQVFNQEEEEEELQFTIVHQPDGKASTISFEIDKPKNVAINIYDLNGNKLLQVCNESKEPGKHVVKANTESLAEGMYVFHIKAGGFTQQKMEILRKPKK